MTNKFEFSVDLDEENAINELTIIENKIKKKKEWLKERDKINEYKEEYVGKTYFSYESLMSTFYVHVFSENFYVEIYLHTKFGNSIKFCKRRFNPNIFSYRKWYEHDEKDFWEMFGDCQSYFEDVLSFKKGVD